MYTDTSHLLGHSTSKVPWLTALFHKHEKKIIHWSLSIWSEIHLLLLFLNEQTENTSVALKASWIFPELATTTGWGAGAVNFGKYYSRLAEEGKLATKETTWKQNRFPSFFSESSTVKWQAIMRHDKQVGHMCSPSDINPLPYTYMNT